MNINPDEHKKIEERMSFSCSVMTIITCVCAHELDKPRNVFQHMNISPDEHKKTEKRISFFCSVMAIITCVCAHELDKPQCKSRITRVSCISTGCLWRRSGGSCTTSRQLQSMPGKASRRFARVTTGTR
jgi:hypothetical protein